jgi:large subunit ribosomal protein L15
MLDTLTRTIKNKKPKLVGRGGTRGKTSGRGTKGQKARAGHKIRPVLRDAIKKLPKLRGRGKNINKAFQIKPQAVNLTRIEMAYEAQESVTPSTLFAKGLITRIGGKFAPVKILAAGDITKGLSFYDCAVSASAKAKIEKAGGVVHG